MVGTRLLAVVEVPQSDRVICQAASCGHSVYKRIHVVQQEGKLIVLGSECYKKLFGDSLSKPSYGSSDGRLLTPEERQMLVENTARLIEKLESEHKEALERNLVQLKKLESEQKASELNNFAQKPVSQISSMSNYLTASAAELQAKRELRNEMGINPDLPGWKGLVEARIKKLRGG